MERISVHICTKDRSTELVQLLQSLRNQIYKNWDVVIVDGSRPTPLVTRKYVNDIINRIKTEGHGVQYMVEKVPDGVCKARNKAVENDRFKNPLILRVDDDSVCEFDYLARLVTLIEDKNIGAVGGVVPLWGSPPFVRNTNCLKGIFNKIRFDKEGNIIYLGDDGGMQYHPAVILPSHHLRSSFLFRKEVFNEVGGFPTEYGMVGFREETKFCMAMAWKGWRMLTDLKAICWHQQCPSGGVRTPDYMRQVQIGDETFRAWAKEKYLKEGNPFEKTRI